MKKISLLLTASLGLAFTASAQLPRLDLDLTLNLIAPLAQSQTQPFLIPCSDSFDIAFTVKNEGPNGLVAGDTLFFSTPFTDSGYVSVITLTNNLAAGDSINLRNRLVKSQIKQVQNPTTLADINYTGQNGEFAFSVLLDHIGTAAGKHFDKNDTTNFSFTMVKVDCNTSVKNITNSSINVYPNPTNGALNFTHNFERATTATVKVLDLMGRVVITEQYDVNAGAKNFNLNVAELANGSYFVELTTAEERGVTKFTIAK